MSFVRSTSQSGGGDRVAPVLSLASGYLRTVRDLAGLLVDAGLSDEVALDLAAEIFTAGMGYMLHLASEETPPA